MRTGRALPVALLWSALLAAVPSLAEEPPAEEPTIALRCGRLLDPASGFKAGERLVIWVIPTASAPIPWIAYASGFTYRSYPNVVIEIQEDACF